MASQQQTANVVYLDPSDLVEVVEPIQFPAPPPPPRRRFSLGATASLGVPSHLDQLSESELKAVGHDLAKLRRSRLSVILVGAKISSARHWISQRREELRALEAEAKAKADRMEAEAEAKAERIAAETKREVQQKNAQIERQYSTLRAGWERLADQRREVDEVATALAAALDRLSGK
jgi:hypothetical protein